MKFNAFSSYVKICWPPGRILGRTVACWALATLTGHGKAEESSIRNSLGMELVLIDAGNYSMGAAMGETLLPTDQWDEQPVHSVTITRPFRMAATEVTNSQYEQFDPDHKKWRGLRGVSREDHEAVTYVSWHEAMAFCRWLSEKEGKPYRLPTEAEWEYACRAGSNTSYWTGSTLPENHHRNQWTETDDLKVNAKDRALRDKKGKVDISLQVASMPPNPWGLSEMHGNVEEWVLDWYGPYSGVKQADPVGPANGMFKVARGGSHNTALKYLRSANRMATLPEDKHWLIGFRVVQAPMPSTEPQAAVPISMNDPSVNTGKAVWKEPESKPVFHEPIPFILTDESHPLLSRFGHHHHPTITWCENGDLLAAWFNTISEIGREMVIVSSRLRYKSGDWAKSWDMERMFFAPADRNTGGSCLLHDGQGRLYFFNAIADSGHHTDQSLMMSVSGNSGKTWSTPRIISDLYQRHKYTPMDSAFVENDGQTIVLSMDYSQLGFRNNESGSGVFMSHDKGVSWENKLSGKIEPQRVATGATDSLAAGFHISTVRLKDGRLLAMTRGQGGWDINGHMTMSYSSDNGDTWTYRESPFPDIGSGQRLVLMRLNEGPLLFVSFEESEKFAALSYDEGNTWPVRKTIGEGRRGYLAATQTPDNLIHLISSDQYFRFNLPWLESDH